MEMIETDSLTKEYGRRLVVNDLTLRVCYGEIFGFLGPNGAGKTTTIRILTTLTKPTSGRVRIDGLDISDPRVKASFGIVQQHISLNRDLTVRENLDLHARLHHLDTKDRKRRISDILDYVDLKDHSDHLIDHISGGMKRRVMIARALIHRPKLLILDEPTVGLDAQSRRRIWDLIRRMNEEGATVFLTTHYIEEAESLCSRVGIINHGRMIASGSPVDLRTELGMFTVQSNGGCKSSFKFFPDRTSAASYASSLSCDRVVMRESNLEDVFVELTGCRVGGD